MILGFGNNVVSSIAEDLTASQETIQVMPGAGALFEGLLTSDFVNKSTPLSVYAKITLSDAGATVFEVCHLISVSGDVLNVIRGQEGTLAKGWSLNDVIANFATRGSESGFAQIAQLQAGTYTAGTAGGTANALTLELPSTFFTNGSTGWELKAPLIVYPIHNNTGASTLQLTIGGRVLGTFPIYKYNLEPLDAGDILKDVGFACLLDSTKSFFTIIGVGVGALPATDYKPRTDSLNNQQPVPVIRDKDMNTCVAGEFGLYEKATCTNSPPSSTANFYCDTKSIYSLDAAGTALIQIAWPYDGVGVLAWRNYSKNTGAWDATWREAYDTGHKPTAADVGAAPLVHTHPGSLPDPIPLAAEDLNTIVAPNVYRQDSDANAITALNYPEPKSGSLIVTVGAGVQQRYHVYNTNRIYSRAQYGEGAFTTWALAYNTQNIPSAADVGASPVGHTHTAEEVGASPVGHTHTAGEVGASPVGHHHSAIEGNWDIISDSWGQIGTYALAGRLDNGGQLSPGDVIAGSSIHLCSAEGVLVGVSPPGTWKALGYAKGDRDYGSWNVTLFIRIV